MSFGVEMRIMGNPSINLDRQRTKLDALRQLNELHKQGRPLESQLDARIASFELAFRMQREAPEAFDLSRESAGTQKAYGLDNPTTDMFGRQCLLARRLVERGVRFVQLFDAPANNVSNELSGEDAGAVIAFEAVLLFGTAAVGKACSRVVTDEVLAVAEGSDGGVTLPFVVPRTAAVAGVGHEPAELVGLMLLAAERALSFGFIWPAAVLRGGIVPAPGEPALGKTVPCCRLP